MLVDQSAFECARVRPFLRLETFFHGSSRGWGIVQDPFGRVRRAFDVDLTGAWTGSRLDLTERFRFDDGAEDHRVWHIAPEGPTGYRATADDVIGTVHGEAAGNMLTWSYDFTLKFQARTLRVRLDDLFVLMNDGVLINRSRISKFGLPLGTITVSFRKA